MSTSPIPQLTNQRDFSRPGLLSLAKAALNVTVAEIFAQATQGMKQKFVWANRNSVTTTGKATQFLRVCPGSQDLHIFCNLGRQKYSFMLMTPIIKHVTSIKQTGLFIQNVVLYRALNQ